MTEKHEDVFVSKVVEVLDEGADSLDNDTRVRLRMARTQALAGTRPGYQGLGWMQWLPASGVAMAMMVVVATTVWMAAPEVDITFIEELEMLVTGESLELIDELEFYQWLDEEGIRAG